MAKTRKTRTPKTRAKVRACLRCGCTDAQACPGDCYWVCNSDVCSACLFADEHDLMEWIERRCGAQEKALRDFGKRQWNAFGRYLNECGALPKTILEIRKAVGL